MSATSNEEDSGGNIIEGRPLARKKSSKSRFGLVQKALEPQTSPVPSSSCSEILSALSREEREFVQGLYTVTPLGARIERRPERPPRSSRQMDRRCMTLRRIPIRAASFALTNTNRHNNPVIREPSAWGLPRFFWKLLLMAVVFIIAIAVSQTGVNIQDAHNKTKV